jgi:putative transposase
MPRGLVRCYGGGDLHFITCSCYHRRSILNVPVRRDLLLDILEQTRVRYRFVVLGYVVMPEHFHLLMSEPQCGTPSTVMQVLKQRFAHRFLRSGQYWAEEALIWQERFYDFNVWTEGKRIEKLRYMHLNPVRRGLVAGPEQWLWSSFRDYHCRQPGRVRVNDCSVLKLETRPPAA